MQNSYNYEDYAPKQSCCEYEKYIEELKRLTDNQPLV